MRREHYFFLIVLILSIVAGLFPIKLVLGNEIDAISDEEYEVCSVALSATMGSDVKLKQFVIRQSTSSYNEMTLVDSFRYDFKKKTGMELGNDLWDDFKKNNQKAYKLENKFSISQVESITLISEEEIKEIFDYKMEWDVQFYRKYPDSNGINRISRPGFNRNHTQALLYYGNRSGTQGGASGYIFLIKEDGKWQVKKIIDVFMI